jgi:hypothetical protein
MHDSVKGPFFFAENVMIHICGIEQEEEGEILFQQYGILPYFCHEVQNALNIQFPNQWIRRCGPVQ